MRPVSLISPRLRLLILKWLSGAKRTAFGRNIDALLVRSRNGLLLVDVDDQYVGRRLAYAGQYGHLELEPLQAVLLPSDNLLIVGTHIGSIAIRVSHSCRSVTAIEANPRTFQLLQLNVAINRYTFAVGPDLGRNDSGRCRLADSAFHYSRQTYSLRRSAAGSFPAGLQSASRGSSSTVSGRTQPRRNDRIPQQWAWVTVRLRALASARRRSNAVRSNSRILAKPRRAR